MNLGQERETQRFSLHQDYPWLTLKQGSLQWMRNVFDDTPLLFINLQAEGAPLPSGSTALTHSFPLPREGPRLETAF